nr:MAG TPA: hypothetical protein [Caudoviricetes sp.]
MLSSFSLLFLLVRSVAAFCAETFAAISSLKPVVSSAKILVASPWSAPSGNSASNACVFALKSASSIVISP